MRPVKLVILASPAGGPASAAKATPKPCYFRSTMHLTNLVSKPASFTCSWLASVALMGCLGLAGRAEADPAAPSGLAVSISPVIVDLRSEEWLMTKVVNTGVGVVQHTGDSIFPAGTVGFLHQRLAAVLPTDPAAVIQLKTSDIRLSIPDAKVDQTTVQSLQHSNPKGAYVVPIVALLTESFSKTKSASAVFCVAVNGRDYLGNDARLFRFGAEGEMKDSIDAAVASLAKNIAAGNATVSPACDPGWEGGQAARP